MALEDVRLLIDVHARNAIWGAVVHLLSAFKTLPARRFVRLSRIQSSWGEHLRIPCNCLRAKVAHCTCSSPRHEGTGLGSSLPKGKGHLSVAAQPNVMCMQAARACAQQRCSSHSCGPGSSPPPTAAARQLLCSSAKAPAGAHVLTGH